MTRTILRTSILATCVLVAATATARAQELTPAAALEVVTTAAESAPPITHRLVLGPQCTIGTARVVPDDIAALRDRGLVTVTHAPVDRAMIETMITDGVNALLGSVPDACIYTIRNRYGGMAGLAASGQRDFVAMDVTLTDAGRAAGLSMGFSEPAILREQPAQVSRVVRVDDDTRRIEYTVRYEATEIGRRTGLADLFIARAGSAARTQTVTRARDLWVPAR